MVVNRRYRAFHDPWGNKRGNHGSVIRMQWLVGLAEQAFSGGTGCIDFEQMISPTKARYVLGKHSVEGIGR